MGRKISCKIIVSLLGCTLGYAWVTGSFHLHTRCVGIKPNYELQQKSKTLFTTATAGATGTHNDQIPNTEQG
jgi:hypothetical protein